MLEDAMLSGEDLYGSPELASHAEWAEDVLRKYPQFCKENAGDIIREEIGKVFLRVLLDAGVFKRDDAGQAAFMRFIGRVTE